MNALTTTYAGQDLVIIGFPCNNFGLQEPGEGEEIPNGVRWVRPGDDFTPTLIFHEKIDVNGVFEYEIYTWLKGLCMYTDPLFAAMSSLYYDPPHADDVKWNFEKFLIARDGTPYTRYDSAVTDAADLEADIDYLLSL